MMAADRLHISPMELENAPIIWRERAFMALDAEHEAQEWHRKNADKRRR